MGLIKTDEVRPEGVTTVYHPDIDTSIVLAQIERKSEAFYNAVNQGGLSVRVRSPTKNKFAALTITLNSYQDRADKAMNDVRELIGELGLTLKDAEFHFNTRQMIFNIEEYEPSSFKKQVQYTVSELPE